MLPLVAIRDTVIRPATVLAPMAGVTDTVFRRVIRSLGGCGLIMTELDRKSTRLNSSHIQKSRMPSSA